MGGVIVSDYVLTETKHRAVARNLLIYTVGIACAVAGALGLSGAIDVQVYLSVVLFITGLILVIIVHEYLDGPF